MFNRTKRPDEFTLSGLATTVIALLLAVLVGCATAPPPPQKETKMVWPPPPLPARIQFVRNIVGEEDVKADTTFSQNLVAFLTGERIPVGRLAEPTGIAVSDDGDRLYVSDLLQHQVFLFDFNKKTFATIDDVGAPAGVALDDKENLYVVDMEKKVIAVFGPDRKRITEIGDPSIQRPIGITIDKQRGKIYLVDTGSKESTEQNVKVYDLAGKRIGTIGATPGGDFGQFNFPMFATLDATGNLYVSDTMNARVQKFDPDGKFLTSFGQLGSNWGEFDKPKGVAVDSFGNLYAVDSGWSNVQIFNPKGQILLFFGGRGPLPGMMKNPISIAIDKRNRIYVGDYLNHRIGVYELVNTTAADSFIVPPAPNPVPQGAKK